MVKQMIDAGKYNKKITIYQVIETTDSQGFPIETTEVVLQPYANVKTTRGFTLIANHSDFEKAYTNFTIRYSHLNFAIISSLLCTAFQFLHLLHQYYLNIELYMFYF